LIFICQIVVGLENSVERAALIKELGVPILSPRLLSGPLPNANLWHLVSNVAAFVALAKTLCRGESG